MNKQNFPEHLIQFLFVEMGTSGTIDKEMGMILKLKFHLKQMESVLRKCIFEWCVL